MTRELLQDADACYQALRTRDARFDGRFFVGVTSTRIYCRPVCRVRPPRQDHCRFFGLAAQAEQAGYRPCLRCRPELAPSDRHWSFHDAGDRLIGHALRWLDDPANGLADIEDRSPLVRLSDHLGITDRHLRRLFSLHLGMTPLQYLQTRRLLTAKLLLTDTPLPIGQVALISGFGSLRRFNDVFLQAYGLSPSRWRKPVPGKPSDRSGMRPARLAWRPPMNMQAMLDFLARRRLLGNEQMIEGPQPGILKAVGLRHNATLHVGWLRARFCAPDHCVLLEVSPSLLQVLPQVIWRVRHWLDLDTDTGPIDRLLDADFPGGGGMRVPGSFDGFELAVRAILGQQVSLHAANRLAERLTAQLGERIETPDSSVDHLFPSPERLAAVSPSVLGELGIVRARQTAIMGLAQACACGALRLDPVDDPSATVLQLQTLPGIGPWTAQYVAMRALRWPDAWPAGDVALRRFLAMRRQGEKPTEGDGDDHRWRPWRSYAAVRAWTSLSLTSEKDRT